MTSLIVRLVSMPRRCPTVFMTWPTTRVGCRWVILPIRRSSRSSRSAVVARAWPVPVPECVDAHDHGGWGWFERVPGPGVEGRASKVRGGGRADGHRVALPAGYVEVEPDRASADLVHLDQLARQALDRHPHDRRADRCDDHQERAHCSVRIRSELVPDRHQDHRRRTRRPTPPTPRLARRMELHNHPLKRDIKPAAGPKR
jgi:hypothetical protein